MNRSIFSNEDLARYKKQIYPAPIVSKRIKIQRINNEFLGCCPDVFHKTRLGKSDTHPSLTIYKLDDGTWGFKCFSCGANGNVFQFVQAVDKISFPAAVSRVLEEAGIEGWEDGEVQAAPADSGEPVVEKKVITFPYSDYQQAEAALEHSTEGRKWLADRGIGYSIARKLHLGFLPSCKAISPTHDWRDRGWVAFPTISEDGKTVLSIKYRSLVAKRKKEGDKTISGILRAADTATTLFNLRAVKPGEDVWIVEGEADTLVLAQAGLTVVGLPMAGYKPSDEEIEILATAKCRFLAGDNDTEGKKAMDKLGERLSGETHRIQWPNNRKDANDVLTHECGNDREKFKTLLEVLKLKAIASAHASRAEVNSREAMVHEIDERPDMSRAVLSGRLGEICGHYMLDDFPVSYAWLSLVTAASVLVPERSASPLGGDNLHNLYTALVGPVNCGKSQAIEWAMKILRIQDDPRRYSEVKPGSAERLLKYMNHLREKDQLGPRVLMFLDEWKFFFDKAAIENSVFPTLLTTGFYRKNTTILDSHGHPLTVPASFSWIGGIVTDSYDDCLSQVTSLGLHDRLLQGINPSNYSGFSYRPFDGEMMPEGFTLQPVEIDCSVWECLKAWRKENPQATREAEIACRVAEICASFDGAPVLYGRDLGPHLILATEQMKLRETLKPNIGETPDAQCAIKIENYLKTHGRPGDWLDFRLMMKEIHYERFGPNAFERTVRGLTGLHIVELSEREAGMGNRPGGRPAKVIRLVQD